MKTALLIVDIQNDYFPGGKMELEGSLEASLRAKEILRLFRAETLPEAGRLLGGMLGLGVPAAAGSALYSLSSFGLLLVIAAVGATELPKKLAATACGLAGGRAGTVLEPLFCLAVLALTAAFLVSGSFNPFLYFRF